MLIFVVACLLPVEAYQECEARRRVAEARNWPSTDGILLTYSTESHVRRMSFEKSTHVRYRYEVDGVSYIGDTIALARARELPDYEESLEEGTPVEVLYNPEDPKECTLLLGHPPSALETVLGTAGIGAFLVLAVAWVFSKNFPVRSDKQQTDC